MLLRVGGLYDDIINVNLHRSAEEWLKDSIHQALVRRVGVLLGDRFGVGEDGQLVGGYFGVYTREICCGPGEKIGVPFKDLFDVVLFSLGEGGANLEELILLC